MPSFRMHAGCTFQELNMCKNERSITDMNKKEKGAKIVNARPEFVTDVPRQLSDERIESIT